VSRHRSLRARMLRTVAVTAVIGIAATAASFVVVRNDVGRLDRRRVDRPATQALLGVQHLMASVDQVLATANGVVAASGLDAQRFRAVLGPDVNVSSTLAGIALVTHTGGSPRVVARVGDTHLLTNAGAALVPGAASTLIAARSDRRGSQLGFAALAAHREAAVYLEVALSTASVPVPFALVTRATPPRLVLGSAAAVPGLVRWSQPVLFGGQTLNLLVRAGPPAGGLFGISLPLLVLLVGLVLTGLAIAVGIAVARRDDAVQYLGVENQALDRALEQQRIVETELRASEERFRTILRDTPDIIVLFDAATGSCEVLNRADFLGHPLDALSAPGGLAALVEPDDRDAADAHWARLTGLEPEQVGETTLRLRDAAGAIRYARLRFSPLDVSDDGDGQRLLGLISDVTDAWTNEAREAELHEALRRSQRLEAVGQLAGGVAHDFNNLLAAIMASAELLVDDVPPGRPQEYAAEIQRSAMRGAALVRELLTFAQRDRAEPRPVDLNEIVAGMEPLLRRTLGEHIHLQVTLSETPAQVIGDPTHLEQVILNLAVNARDAMPDGGVLWIATAIDLDEEAAHDDRVVLSVTDTGEGIPNEIRARMFEPFVTSKDVGKGTGLGLATVRSIVTGMEGEIEVLTKIGEGTTFEISLARSAAAADVVGELEVAAQINGARRRVLLVEDEESVRFALARLLQRLDFVVTTAVNGAEALHTVEQQTFDLVITDAVMPGMSGPQLIEHLGDARPELRVLLMSGYTPDEMQKGEGSTVPRLRKPFTMSDLTRALDLVLDHDVMQQPVT
jgi:signal transduction histidine kinase/ActR/RegA family two-component response regulator